MVQYLGKLTLAAEYLDIKIEWQGTGLEEKGIDGSTGRVIVEVNSKYYRPTEVDTLIGNPGKAENKLNWEPKITFKELVKEMAHEDFRLAQVELDVKQSGSRFQSNKGSYEKICLAFYLERLPCKQS